MAAILGGWGSSTGAVVGGFTLGILESLFTGIVPAGYKDALAFVLLIVVVYFRPSGLLGTPSARVRRDERRTPPLPSPPTAPGFVATLEEARSFIFKLVFVAVLLIWPVLLPNTYNMSVMTTAGFFAIIVVAVGLILGQAGQLSFGHTAFYGIGAYVAAILATNYHWNTLLALVAGAAAAGLVALIIGRPVLKLKYFYLALATIGLGQIFVIVVIQLTMTGGANGFGPIPSLSIFGFEFEHPHAAVLRGVGRRHHDPAVHRPRAQVPVRSLAALARDERDRRLHAGRAHGQLEARGLRRQRRLLRHRRRSVRLRVRGDHARRTSRSPLRCCPSS